MSSTNEPVIHLRDKVAIVTGASRGIGAAIASAFARSGAKVVIASRKLEGLEAVATEIRGMGGEVEAVACHTGRPEDVEALFTAAVERFGKVDVLVNNAATNPYFGPTMNVEWSAWDKTFEVNVKGYFATTRELVRHLEERGAKGAVVNVASVAGLMASPLQCVYAMTKAAVISMTKTLAVELSGAGVRVNAIAPGWIDTRFSQAVVGEESMRKMILERTPAGRVGDPADIAGLALYLASDAAGFVTGAVYVADGGFTLT